MPICGSQCILCDLPIRFDTYKGCSHGCKYCFARKKVDIMKIEPNEDAKGLLNFINGQRDGTTVWCDWDIPLHIGGMSDPFQPVEREYKRTLECLKILSQTKYPVVISTKGKLCIEEPYLSLLKQCNVVMQISMACSKYDVLEPGAPTYEERLHMVEVLSKNVKRVIIRCQPYLHEFINEIKQEISRYKEAGAYGVIFEGMKFVKSQPNMVRIAGDICYPYEVLHNDFLILRDECHKNELKFYSGENRLRKMGDSLTCCGCDDLDGFVVNKYNLNHLLNGDIQEPTAKQQEIDTAQAFLTIHQNTSYNLWRKDKSFKDAMLFELKSRKKSIYDIFGISKR